MRTSENAFRMTVFFGRPEPPDGQIAYGGTAFAVVHKEDGYGFGYLVTARHVAEQVVPNGEIVVRVNTPDKKSQDIPIDEIKWSYHPDPTVDVAVTGPKLSRPDFDIAYYNLADLVVPSSSEFRVQCGDPICIVGLFHWHVGATRNKPIVHSGTIAMLPDETEKIPLKNRTTGKRQDVVAYLVEAQTFDGLSGAPVFHREMVTLKKSTALQRHYSYRSTGISSRFPRRTRPADCFLCTWRSRRSAWPLASTVVQTLSRPGSVKVERTLETT